MALVVAEELAGADWRGLRHVVVIVNDVSGM
jgi:hypothetical protein